MNDRFFLWQEAPGYCALYMHGPLKGFFDVYRQELDVNISNFSVYYEKHNAHFYVKENEWHKEGLKAFERIKSDQEFVEKLFSIISASSKELFDVSRKIQNTDLKSLSDQKLWELIEGFFKPYTKVWSYGQIQNLPDFENDYVTKYLLSWIENKIKELKTDMKKTIAFATLITPTKKSFAQKEEIDLMKLLIEIKKNKDVEEILKQEDLEKVLQELEKYPKEFELIKSHWRKYCWLQYNFLGPASDLNYYLDIIGSYLRQGTDQEKQLNEIAEKEKKLEEKQKELLALFGPEKEVKNLFEYAKRVGFAKIERMEASYFGYFVLEKVCKEIAMRLHLAVNQVRSLYYSELKDVLLKKEFDLAKINEKYEHGFLKATKNSIKYAGGKEAVELHEELLRNCRKEEKKNELRGSPAYPGYAIGKAKIIIEAKEMGKMQEGDILVSAATSPDLLPAMKKASAILTDTGGITCHAAIVSRELKIPCVIGLKSATKNFNDRDLLDVNANHGIVKKIKDENIK